MENVKYRCDDLGYEVPDSTPLELPTRLRMPQSRAEQIRAFVRHEMSRHAEENGSETFEEADDFDIPDFEPRSKYELAELEPESQAPLQAASKTAAPAAAAPVVPAPTTVPTE